MAGASGLRAKTNARRGKSKEPRRASAQVRMRGHGQGTQEFPDLVSDADEPVWVVVTSGAVFFKTAQIQAAVACCPALIRPAPSIEVLRDWSVPFHCG